MIGGWRPGRHGAAAVRYLVLTALMVTAVGVAGTLLAWPLLTSTIGPTAYVFAANPRTEPARFRNAALGHGAAIGIGVASLYAFGLVHAAPVSTRGAPTPLQIGASAVAVGTTLFVLELLHSHHAPSAATALLISTGLAKPGAPLIGLVVGLALVVSVGPFVGRLPLARQEAAQDASAAAKRPPADLQWTGGRLGEHG